MFESGSNRTCWSGLTMSAPEGRTDPPVTLVEPLLMKCIVRDRFSGVIIDRGGFVVGRSLSVHRVEYRR